ADGYPGHYRKGDGITGLEQAAEIDDTKLFHAGTAFEAGRVLTHGGRVMCATALGGSVGEAQARAYNLVKAVHWKGMYYRTDIGYRAIARERQPS
ncbi:MAG: phosphoribosylglycinamide synthetase C domain-containing protein, partial [Candidatus Competibacteraceae bacterium]|nr:phosphoribosylglycinamide synthetase C domain-containing protein [Candidatus Competibacteraceae bacterium]